jgi:hypothetical protein
MTYPKITRTADPRIRIAQYGPKNFRTEVQDEPGADWSITGPAYLTRAEALLMVDETASRHFGDPTWDRERSLRAQVERLTAQRDELQRKVFEEKRHNGALIVDADRREQRALALLPDCEAHRRELLYLRHAVSEYWHAMNDSEEARQAVVMANLLTARRCGEMPPGATVAPADLAAWLTANTGKQDKALRRHSFPTQADCIRAGGCDHAHACEHVRRDLAEALGLTAADLPAPVTT